MSENIITRAKAAAKNHSDNVAVKALMQKLETAQATAKFSAETINKFPNQLIGYEKGCQGEDGYYPPSVIPNGLLDVQMRHMAILHEVGIITWCLVSVLEALGEQVEV